MRQLRGACRLHRQLAQRDCESTRTCPKRAHRKSGQGALDTCRPAQGRRERLHALARLLGGDADAGVGGTRRHSSCDRLKVSGVSMRQDGCVGRIPPWSARHGRDRISKRPARTGPRASSGCACGLAGSWLYGYILLRHVASQASGAFAPIDQSRCRRGRWRRPPRRRCRREPAPVEAGGSARATTVRSPWSAQWTYTPENRSLATRASRLHRIIAPASARALAGGLRLSVRAANKITAVRPSNML